jgi:uncharacterized OsmC-like protein
MLEYRVTVDRTGPGAAAASCARCPGVTIALDTEPADRTDALNPAELLLAAVGACLLKGIERVAPILRFELTGVHIQVHGLRQVTPPKLRRIDFDFAVVSAESDRRLELLHANVRKFGTITNTLAGAVELTGSLHRARPIAAAPRREPSDAVLAVPSAFGTPLDDYC